MSITSIRRFNFSVGFIGFLIFAFAFVMLNVDPDNLISRAKGYAVEKIETELTEKYPVLAKFSDKGEDDAGGLLAVIGNATGGGLSTLIDQGISEKFNSVPGSNALSRLSGAIMKFEIDGQNIAEITKNHIDHVVDGLVNDLRIFTASNAVVFAMMMFVSASKGEIARRLLPVAIMLLVVVSVSIYWYIFGQNWVSAILFNQYVGYAYAATMTLMFLFLCDMYFLHGKVTEAILNSIVSAAPS